MDIGINFKHRIDKAKNHTVYIKSKNVELIMGEDTGEAINKLTTSLYENYYAQEHVLRDVSDFAFDGVDMLGIHFHKIDPVRGSSYIESPEWLKNKGATINPHNTKDNYCFMYAVTIALCHEEIG